ncbi:PTS mannose/fructose/sorbose/N-acetylgalactosamine transporter subunit IIC [Bacillus mycoides]|uniref:PTS mannose/fructose/sorbose/N-acetylgalactosamine transporter subunit IIC n=1 Tax=Bacillus mycoides TaxID=1405 RepID=UPI0008642DFE|nr:PTS sugar transporter subunit IIC [Bacillus mycoides]OHX32159.1 PTS system sorbose-specific iic component [Bacillus mycoides]SCM85756.1 PTS system, IIC component [Bacillus mycoides]
MLTQTLLIFLVAVLGYLNSFFGSIMINRPIVMGMLVGLVLGDLTTGIKVGASLELVWLGVMAIGASNPPDMVSGSIIGTSYVIVTNSSIATAVALAVPISMLMQMLWNVLMIVWIPLLVAKADKYAKEANYRGIDRMHYIAVFSQAVLLAGLTSTGFYFGSKAIQSFVDTIPDFVNSGLNYAMGIIPAIGFALLVKMIVNKKTACFLFLGFLLVAYLKISVLGVTAFACVLTAILLFNTGHSSSNNHVQEVIDDNEF